MGQPQPLFVYFPFSQPVELNLDCTDQSWLLYPLEHHHGPIKILHIFFRYGQSYTAIYGRSKELFLINLPFMAL